MMAQSCFRQSTEQPLRQRPSLETDTFKPPCGIAKNSEKVFGIPGRRGRLSDHARKPDFRGFASFRHLRAFENRAKARIDRLCLFEPAPKGKKARIFIAFTLRPDGRPGRSYKLADETVSGEPVCEANSLLSGKKTGNFAKSLA